MRTRTKFIELKKTNLFGQDTEIISILRANLTQPLLKYFPYARHDVMEMIVSVWRVLWGAHSAYLYILNYKSLL